MIIDFRLLKGRFHKLFRSQMSNEKVQHAQTIIQQGVYLQSPARRHSYAGTGKSLESYTEGRIDK